MTQAGSERPAGPPPGGVSAVAAGDQLRDMLAAAERAAEEIRRRASQELEAVRENQRQFVGTLAAIRDALTGIIETLAPPPPEAHAEPSGTMAAGASAARPGPEEALRTPEPLIAAAHAAAAASGDDEDAAAALRLIARG